MDLKIAALKKDELSLYRSFLLNEALVQYREDRVHILGALSEGKLVGVLAFAEDEPARILSLTVSPDYQRKGIGSALLDDLAGRLIASGAEGMEAYLFGTDEPEFKELSAFLYNCGLVLEESYPQVVVSLGQAAAKKEFARLSGEKSFRNIRLLSELSGVEKKDLGKLLSIKAGYHNFPRKGLIEKISCVYEDKGEPVGCVLLGEKREVLVLQFVFLSEDHSDRTAIFRMMSRSLESAREIYGDDQKLRILAMQETAEKLVDYFFAGTEDADRLNRFYLPFRKEDEDLPESAEEEEDEEDPQPEEQTEKGGPMSVDPEFHILTNVDLVCRDCIYRIPEMGVGTCHKYLMKTGEVLNGEACPKHRKEKEG